MDIWQEEDEIICPYCDERYDSLEFNSGIIQCLECKENFKLNKKIVVICTSTKIEEK